MSRFLLLLTAVSISVGCGSNPDQKGASNLQPPPNLGEANVVPFAPAPPPAVAVFDDANAIVVDPKDLGIGIDLGKRYPTQTIETTGMISEIDAVSANASSVGIANGEMELLCAVLEPQVWARLAPGQIVTLHGAKATIPGTLYSFAWKVVKADPNPCPIVNSKKMAEDFEFDATAAFEKYNEKWFYLTGKVTGVTMEEFDNSTMTMEGSSLWTVEVPMNHSFGDIVKTLKIGQSTTVLCRYESFDFKPSDRKLSVMGRPITTTFPVPGVTYGGVSPVEPSR